MEIKFALRDEKINIFAMTYGRLPSKYSHQFLLCKKKPFSENREGPFLLDMKKSAPNYKLSQQGASYLQSIIDKKIDLSYVAFVDCQIKIRVCIDLFEKINDLGFFSIWDPKAPLRYFNGQTEGYLIIFKVFLIEDIVFERLLEKGRRGRNFYFSLNESFLSNAVHPVIEEKKFNRMKTELIDNLKKNGWLLGFWELRYDKPRIKKYSLEDIRNIEEEVYIENKCLSLIDLVKKIKSKKTQKRIIAIDSKRYYRDPDVSSYALKRANGKCECCGKDAPFKRDDGRPFLETHHLVPLSNGGKDTIENVCAVCPNCHKQLHFGPDREQLTNTILRLIAVDSDEIT